VAAARDDRQTRSGAECLGKYEAELRPLNGIGLTDVEMDSVLTLVLAHVEGMARWQVSLGQLRERSGQGDDEWRVDRAPTPAVLMDTNAFPLATRVGQAVGEYHPAPATPRTRWSSGWNGSWMACRI
jgi:Tetracyclin repressor-like, C-terminal domain